MSIQCFRNSLSLGKMSTTLLSFQLLSWDMCLSVVTAHSVDAETLQFSQHYCVLSWNKGVNALQWQEKQHVLVSLLSVIQATFSGVKQFLPSVHLLFITWLRTILAFSLGKEMQVVPLCRHLNQILSSQNYSWGTHVLGNWWVVTALLDIKDLCSDLFSMLSFELRVPVV